MTKTKFGNDLLHSFIVTGLYSNESIEFCLSNLGQLFNVGEFELLQISHRLALRSIKVSFDKDQRVRFDRSFIVTPVAAEVNSLVFLVKKIVQNNYGQTSEFFRSRDAVDFNSLIRYHISLLSERFCDFSKLQQEVILTLLQIADNPKAAIALARGEDCEESSSLLGLCEIRGLLESDKGSNKALADFKKIETGCLPTRQSYISSTGKFSLFSKIKSILTIYCLFTQISIRYLLNRKISRQEILQWKTNENHWLLNCEVLASYWQGPKFSSDPAYRLALNALFSNNIIVKIKSLDWSLFVLVHDFQVPFKLLLFSLLESITKGICEFLVTDIKMHKSILLYYDCQFSRSLEIQLENESSLKEWITRFQSNCKSIKCHALGSCIEQNRNPCFNFQKNSKSTNIYN